MQNITIHVCLRPGRKTQLAQGIAHDTSNFRPAQIGPHGLGAGNPVVTRSPFHGIEFLVNEHNYGVLVVWRDLLPLGAVGEPSIVRNFTNARKIGTQEVGQGFQGAAVSSRSIVIFRPSINGWLPALNRHHGPH